jgi:fructose-1,6-bisphosphatase/inositol monophosphatase family enzyme
MESRYAREFDLIVELIHGSGELSGQLFYSDGFEVFVKAGGSRVTSIDLAVSRYVVEEARKRGYRVRSEEEGSSAQYGENGVLDLDPIDSTSDLVKGYQRRPRRSNAAPSLGFWDNESVAGAVVFPLLGVAPITYTACKGGGAYREQDGRTVRLEIDTTPRHGVVFVTSKNTPAAQKMSNELSRMGYTPVPEHGAVFKACGVADRELLRQYPYHAARDSALPVVGLVFLKTHLHDVAATTCIVREAGGVATTPQNRDGEQLWIAANNQAVYDDLAELVATK